LATSLHVSLEETLVTFHDLSPGRDVVGDMLSTLADHGIGVDLLTETSREDGIISLSFTIPTPKLEAALEALSSFGTPLHDSLVVKLTVEGEKLRTSPHVAARFFRVLGKTRVNPLMISSSETRISTLINRSDFTPGLENEIREELGLRT